MAPGRMLALSCMAPWQPELDPKCCSGVCLHLLHIQDSMPVNGQMVIPQASSQGP